MKQAEDGSCWYEVDAAFAREKIGCMFRDTLHTQYRSSTKAKQARKRIARRRRQEKASQDNDGQSSGSASSSSSLASTTEEFYPLPEPAPSSTPLKEYETEWNPRPLVVTPPPPSNDFCVSNITDDLLSLDPISAVSAAIDIIDDDGTFQVPSAAELSSFLDECLLG